MKDSVKYPAILQKKSWDRTIMYPLEGEGSPIKNIKVRLIPRTNRTLARFFIDKKPPRHMLRIIE